MTPEGGSAPDFPSFLLGTSPRLQHPPLLLRKAGAGGGGAGGRAVRRRPRSVIPALGGWGKLPWHLTPTVRKPFPSSLDYPRLFLFSEVLCQKCQSASGEKIKGHHFFGKAISFHPAKSFKNVLAIGPRNFISGNLSQGSCVFTIEFFIMVTVETNLKVQRGVREGERRAGRRWRTAQTHNGVLYNHLKVMFTNSL